MATEKQSESINGGKRVGAGRKPGVPNKRTAKIQAEVEATGITPLDYMLSIMRMSDVPPDAELNQIIALTTLRFEAAKAAAPYVHPKLSSIDVTGAGKNGEHLVSVTVGFD